jgi:phosphatidylserine/phosphatidylglycerophosphate/cardiolipin synthase-like enzyme
MRSREVSLTGIVALVIGPIGCGAPAPGEESWDATSSSAVAEGSPEAQAVLALVNDASVDVAELDDGAGLDGRAADGIIAHRNGADGVVASADDDAFDTIAELDAVPYVGASALDKLLAYAKAHGYMPGSEGPSAEDIDCAALALANDAAATVAVLDEAVGLDRRAAENIVAGRPFATLAEVDAVAYVGAAAMTTLREYAVAQGYPGCAAGGVDVIFSPQAYANSHNARIAALIGTAEHSIDIAMYSFSDAAISSALEAAVARGVKVRFLFDTASADKSETGSALENSKSARLEQAGINVRYVNKILHHKFAIVDGPRDHLERADTATLVTGSGNWSNGAATKYDENTLFLEQAPELTLRMQREFNHLWSHSRDFVWDATLPYELSTLAIDDAVIADDPAVDAYFTSANFKVTSTTFSIVTGRDEVANQWVAAIEQATDSIWIASGHLRSRPISEALMAKAVANPDMDIRVYLDGQEYVSSWAHAQQQDELEACLTAAGTSASKQRQCYDKGFLFSYVVAEAGVDLRFKYYAFRWDASYAKQMHHKLMIVDGDELWTGSYNLSDNAEHATFENMLVFRGPVYQALIDRYRDNFTSMWDIGRGSYDALGATVQTADTIPLVFAPMALYRGEIEALKSLISANCPAVWTDPYKDEPQLHQSCPRAD